jgi:hypothetical protein
MERDGYYGRPQNAKPAQFSKEHYKNRMASALEARAWKSGPANVGISLRRDEPCTMHVVAPKPAATLKAALMKLR